MVIHSELALLDCVQHGLFLIARGLCDEVMSSLNRAEFCGSYIVAASSIIILNCSHTAIIAVAVVNRPLIELLD